MKIIQLSEAEAANPTIVALVAKHLFDGSVSMVSDEPVKNSLHVDDNPSTGFPPDAPAAVNQPAASAVVDPMTIGFGPVPEPAMVLPFPGATVPVAANLVSAPAVAAAPSSTVELDKHGLPWDARIHSGGENKKNADGSWRKRKGVADTTVAAVTAELRQILAVPALAAAPVAQPPMPPAPPAVAAQTVQTPLPPAPPAGDTQAAIVPPAPVAEAITFDSWMKELTPVMTKQWVTTELFTALIQGCYPDQPGAALPALVMRPELIPPVRAAMAAHLDGSHPGWRELQA